MMTMQCIWVFCKAWTYCTEGMPHTVWVIYDRVVEKYQTVYKYIHHKFLHEIAGTYQVLFVYAFRKIFEVFLFQNLFVCSQFDSIRGYFLTFFLFLYYFKIMKRKNSRGPHRHPRRCPLAPPKEDGSWWRSVIEMHLRILL